MQVKVSNVSYNIDQRPIEVIGKVVEISIGSHSELFTTKEVDEIISALNKAKAHIERNYNARQAMERY